MAQNGQASLLGDGGLNWVLKVVLESLQREPPDCLPRSQTISFPSFALVPHQLNGSNID